MTAAPGPMEPLVVDVTDLPANSAGTIGALARLRLAARRTGHRVRLRGATAELRELLELAGLAGEFEWEAEERE
ncbi:STAS domain-containing protein [Actinacidiphila alni]|uniref:STAS domain-containing protein n=1 Tax=Actinacidiphila alni TaxID=380248 RepID=A0A1I2E5M7_9ACTN|nr:STAS domain-containing protein [Actinacidiphila alni]SFE87791.1 STAS domain-containing protein [Actinacidiphila alni]